MNQLSFNLKVFEIAQEAEKTIEHLKQLKEKYKKNGNKWAYELFTNTVKFREEDLVEFKRKHGLIQ